MNIEKAGKVLGVVEDLVDIGVKIFHPHKAPSSGSSTEVTGDDLAELSEAAQGGIMSEIRSKVEEIEKFVNKDATMQFMTFALLSAVGDLVKKNEQSQPCRDEIGNVLIALISLVKIKYNASLGFMIEKISTNEENFCKTFDLHEALILIFKDVGRWSDSGFKIACRYHLLESIIYDLMYIANMHGYKILDCLRLSEEIENVVGNEKAQG